jgi:hypothetical protein
MRSLFKRDAAERVAATAVQGVLSVVTAELIAEAVSVSEDTKKLMVLLLMPIFAAIKAWAAKKVGSPDDASFLRK